MKNLRASIDIGSNSTLLLAGNYQNGKFEELANESRITGLGRGLDIDKAFIPEAMSDGLEALKEYSAICVKLGIKPEDVIVTATEASRVARNAKDYFAKIKKETGLNIQTITSDAEAYYSARGVLFDPLIKDKTIYIMDIGGASTEIIEVETKPFKIIRSISLPMGAVRMTSWLKEKNNLDKVEEIFTKFSDISSYKTKKLFCVAGTMTSIGNMYLGHSEFVEKEVNLLELTSKDLNNVVEKYFPIAEADILKKFPFLGKRSRTIHGGMLVAKTVCDKLAVEKIVISTYGLRYGTLIEGVIKHEFLFK
ncbi:MAG: hypothetical protein JNM93_10665 [Bacteriovoracaceae bacterium]|nr:hypothetical protein [Bacteriovoracaceae bacterium]